MWCFGSVLAVASMVLVAAGCGDGLRRPPAHGFVIAPPGRLGPLRIGERESDVLAALGPGVVTRRFPKDPLTGERGRERTYRGRGLVLDVVIPFRAGTPAWISDMRTTDRRYRTRSGVGVGSSADQVHSLPGLRCFDHRCQLGFEPTTVFQLQGGRVTMIWLASSAD
jgi:hypothetical protein